MPKKKLVVGAVTFVVALLIPLWVVSPDDPAPPAAVDRRRVPSTRAKSTRGGTRPRPCDWKRWRGDAVATRRSRETDARGLGPRTQSSTTAPSGSR